MPLQLSYIRIEENGGDVVKHHFGEMTIVIGKFYDNRNLFYVGHDSTIQYIYDTEKGFKTEANALKYAKRTLKKALQTVIASLKLEDGTRDGQL